MRQIIDVERFKTGHGTHYYNVTWRGNFTDKELIDVVDNKNFDPIEDESLIVGYNYGGIVTRFSDDVNVADVHSGIVEVWYD